MEFSRIQFSGDVMHGYLWHCHNYSTWTLFVLHMSSEHHFN